MTSPYSPSVVAPALLVVSPGTAAERAVPIPDRIFVGRQCAGIEPERFEVVVNVLSMEPPRRVRVRVQVPESVSTVPTLFGLWPGTEAMEREVWDMFGIAFDGHPDLTRILMPEDWVGHPLRKDEAIGRIPVQFKGTADAR